MKTKPKVHPEVGLVMGSDSDGTLVAPAVKILRDFGIRYEVAVISAHRTPRLAARYAQQANRRKIKVIIAAAGGAAHLAGFLAAHTTLPVIGIPIASRALNGLDALLSTIQMPAGIPVATVTLGSAGPVNAAILTIQILALHRTDLAARLQAYKHSLKEKVKKGNIQVQSLLEKIHE